MSREDTCKSLLLKFYGLDSDADCKKDKKLSTSTGIENFENVQDLDETSAEHLISTEEIEESQNDVDYLDRISDEKNDTILSKSPHVLTIDDFSTESKEDFQEPDSELDITSDSLDKFTTKNLARLEDTFTKAVAKTNDLPIRSDFNIVENNSNLSPASVTSKAKKLWRQKSILLKENTGCPKNLLSNFNGVFLDLNHMGITEFPMDLMHRLKNLQMLYLDSNNLKEIPEDFFIILKKLKWLDVRNNQLSSLPSTLKGHESLETLLLQGNNLERLPLELGSVPNLKNLQTAHNPLVFPPQDILEKDCLSILNFLRKEWNRLHKDEQIELKKVSYDTVDKKPSTIICYLQPGEKNLQRRFKYHNLNTLKSSVRIKTWNYKPTSRCNSAGLDFTRQQKQLWKNAAKKILTEQATELQKRLLVNYSILKYLKVCKIGGKSDFLLENRDKKVLAQWKCSYYALKNKKIPSKYLKDPPYALHTVNLQDEPHLTRTRKTLKYKYDAKTFCENYKQIENSLKALGDTNSITGVTPRSKQLELCTEIDRINDLRKSINDLKLCTHLLMPES